MGDEQRTYLRIPTRLHGRMRRLARSEEHQLFREAPIVSSSVTAQELKSSGLTEGLINAFMNLDRKLDLLLGLHAYDNLQNEFPHSMEIHEISGAGVKMTCDQPLAPGDRMELVIVLTQLPVRMASAIAQVVRGEEDTERMIWALDFTKIRDRDLETIVQFVFQTQRDELRGKKWS